MPAPNLSDVNDFLVAESGRIQADMDKQSRARGYNWNALVQRNPFPLGMGETLTKVNYERTTPVTDSGWSQVRLNPPPGTPASGNNANVPTDQIDPASTNYEYSLFYRALNSNPMTIHDANLSLAFGEQLDAIVDNLEGNVADIWEDRKQDEYDRMCGHKIICELDGQPQSGFDQAWLATPSTSRLTIEHLKECYYNLMRDGGARGLDTVQGNPTPLLIVEPEAWDDILLNNPEIREDYRHSSEADITLNPLGITKAYQNFKVVFNYRAPRHDWNGSWLRRSYYSNSAATIGTKADPSTEYRLAQYATAYIFHPLVYELLVYDPDTSYQNGAKFDADTWMGRFKWVNNKDNDLNIDGHIGYFRALLGSASKPGLPNLGYALRYCRNPRNFGKMGCDSQY